jgi:DNA-binding transcriptional LysR family regulator
VAGGLGAAIMPRLSVDAADPGTAAIDLTGLLGPRVLVLVWHRERRLRPAAARFRRATVAACASFAAR